MESNEFFIGWHSRTIGKIAYDGIGWTFNYEDGWLLPMTLANNLRPNAIPASLLSMMPEGFRADAMFGDQDIDLLETLKSSERLMSNIVIVDLKEKIEKIPPDRLHGKLNDWTKDATFCGKLEGVPRIVGAFIADLRELVSRRSMPLMSGYQAKIPVHLDKNGSLSPAEFTAFTHILKLPGLTGDKDYTRSINEWTCMTLAKSGGINTAEFSLAALADDKIGLISERFDIARDEDDMRLLFSEQFCAVFNKGAATTLKYKATAAEVGEKLREVSTGFDKDSREFLKQVCANLLLENGDFHLKNMSMLKVASPTLDQYRSVRLAPAYDIMNTRTFAEHPQPQDEDEEEPCVFKVNGKDTNVTMKDMVILGKTMDIDEIETRAMLESVASGMMARARDLYESQPQLIAVQPLGKKLVQWLCVRLSKRASELFPEMDNSLEIDSDKMTPTNTKHTKKRNL